MWLVQDIIWCDVIGAGYDVIGEGYDVIGAEYDVIGARYAMMWLVLEVILFMS